MSSNNRIFVSIASYRDPELVPTLLDMINNASHPEALSIAVCWQDDQDTTLFSNAGITLLKTMTHEGRALFVFEYAGAVIQVVSVHYFESKGACWARHLSETLFSHEEYFLQIDSHCRFIAQWDKEMMQMLEGLRTQSPKPVLSSYPPGYEPGDENSKKDFVNRLVFREFTDDGLIMLSSVTINAEHPLRGSYIAGGFVFADGRYVTEVPNDPNIFFAGEEIAMACRAFTHGYDVYTPHKILLWHYYERKEQNKVWGDHSNEAKEAGKISQAWWELDKISKSRVRTLLGQEIPPCDLGRYSHGTARTLNEFERAIGASFQHRIVHPEVVGKERISYFPPQTDATEEWLKNLILFNTKKINLTSEELTIAQQDIKWWHIGVYSQANRLLEKKILSREDINAMLSISENNTVQVSFTFSSSREQKPYWIRSCPFINNSGWGKVVEKAW